MKKFNLEQFIERNQRSLEDSSNLTKFKINKLEAASKAAEIDLGMAFDIVETLGQSKEGIENCLGKITFSPPEEYLCASTENVNHFSWIVLGRWLRAMWPSEYELFHEFEAKDWALLLHEFRCFAVTTFIASEWIWHDDIPVFMRNLKDKTDSFRDLLNKMEKDSLAFEKYFEFMRMHFSSEVKKINQVEKMFDRLFLLQLKFGTAVQEYSVWWFDGEGWNKRRSLKINDWAFFVLEEHVAAILRTKSKIKNENLVHITNALRAAFEKSPLKHEAFFQRRKRLKKWLRINVFENMLAKRYE